MPTALIIFDHVFLLLLFMIALFFGAAGMALWHCRRHSSVSRQPLLHA